MGSKESFRRLFYSRVAREAGWSMGLRAASAGIGFVTTILLARALGAEGYGIYAFAWSLVTLLAMPAHAGLPNLVLRETARGLAEGRPDLVKGVWWWSGRVVAVLSLVMIGLIGPLLVAWQGGLKSSAGQTLAWALALVPLLALGNLLGAALRGMQYVVLGLLPEFFLRPALFLLFVVGSAQLWAEKLSPPVAMKLLATAFLVAFIVGIKLLWRLMPSAVRRSRPALKKSGWLASSIIFALMAGFNVINDQASTVILGIFEAPDVVGRFRVAVQMATLSAFGLQAINLVVAPRFADLWSRGEKERLQRLATRSAQVVLTFNFVVALLFALAGRPLLRMLFGTEFTGAYLPLLILLAGQLVNSAAGSVGYLLNMTGHERETAKAMTAAGVLNLMLATVLIPIWGMIGAAAATAISMALWNGLLWWWVRKRLGINSLAFNMQLK